MSILIIVCFMIVGWMIGHLVYYVFFRYKPESDSCLYDEEDGFSIKDDDAQRLKSFVADLNRIPAAKKIFYEDAAKLISFVIQAMQILDVTEVSNDLYSLAMYDYRFILCIKPTDKPVYYCLNDFNDDWIGKEGYQRATDFHVQMFVADFPTIRAILRRYQEQLLTKVPKVDLDCFKES